MCGIVGILGGHEVAPILVESLRRLEYRGYDSAGIATVREGRIERRRAVGKLVNLSDCLTRKPLMGRAGIGHTRWATHGKATRDNCHPHVSGRVAVVHNGIIENFKELRAELRDAGLTGTTETDTEVVAMLAEARMEDGLSPSEAVASVLPRLEGSFALAFLFEGEDDLMIGARKGSPLVIGHGEGEMFLGSDAIALATMTDRLTYLEDGDWCVVTRGGATVFDAAGRRANRPAKRVAAERERVDKAGHKHFMAKEIAEQPMVLAGVVERYAGVSGGGIALPEGLNIASVERVALVACGTAFYACLAARYWFERIAGLPVEADIASEFRYREPPIAPNTLAVCVSQSGETADTLAALRYCRDKASVAAAVTNVEDSSIAREADVVLPILAGVEIGVASTKAFTNQLATLYILALATARARGRLSDAELSGKLAALRELPALLNQALGIGNDAREIARELAETRDVLFIGRGSMYPLALEAALKLKEISYIHAEGYASGELKHGPIALVDGHTPVVVMAPTGPLFEKTMSNMEEVMARQGRILLITDRAGRDAASDGPWRVMVLPSVDPDLTPILYAVPAQLIAYHTAVEKGTDVDQPRNLAKSVTVE